MISPDRFAVCGQVDIVEEQDGFAGPERFVWSQGSLPLEEIDGSDVLDQKWSDSASEGATDYSLSRAAARLAAACLSFRPISRNK